MSSPGTITSFFTFCGTESSGNCTGPLEVPLYGRLGRRNWRDWGKDRTSSIMSKMVNRLLRATTVLLSAANRGRLHVSGASPKLSPRPQQRTRVRDRLWHTNFFAKALFVRHASINRCCRRVGIYSRHQRAISDRSRGLSRPSRAAAAVAGLSPAPEFPRPESH